MDSKRNVERLIFLGIIVVKKIKKSNYIRFATREEIDQIAINNNTRARYNNKNINGI